MKNAIMLAALVAFAAGCQTRITAEKFPETPLAIQEKVTVNGQEQLVAKSYAMASGGWYVTARSPLWAKEQIRGLDVGANPDGSVWLRTDQYDRDLSTNAVVLTKTMFDGGAALVAAVAKAYATISGGGSVDAATAVAQKAYALFAGKGGDASKAKVTVDEAAKTLKVDDGSTCISCDADGNCTDCSYTP